MKKSCLGQTEGSNGYHRLLSSVSADALFFLVEQKINFEIPRSQDTLTQVRHTFPRPQRGTHNYSEAIKEIQLPCWKYHVAMLEIPTASYSSCVGGMIHFSSNITGEVYRGQGGGATLPT